MVRDATLSVCATAGFTPTIAHEAPPDPYSLLAMVGAGGRDRRRRGVDGASVHGRGRVPADRRGHAHAENRDGMATQQSDAGSTHRHQGTEGAALGSRENSGEICSHRQSSVLVTTVGAEASGNERIGRGGRGGVAHHERSLQCQRHSLDDGPSVELSVGRCHRGELTELASYPIEVLIEDRVVAAGEVDLVVEGGNGVGFTGHRAQDVERDDVARPPPTRP